MRNTPLLPFVLVSLTALTLGLAATSAKAQRYDEPQAVNPLAQARGRIEENKPKKPTARQIENVEARVATALAIVKRFEVEAKALGRASGWRQTSLDALLGLPLAVLRRVEQEAVSADSLAVVAAKAASDPQVLGDSDADLVYTPITPCRYIDTRVIAGKITGVRGYSLENNGSAYGGATPCAPELVFGVDDDAFGAIAMNVTIVDPSVAPGFVAVKPQLDSPVTSWLNWYEVGPTVQAANQGAVMILRDLATPDEFVIQASAAVHVIVDLFGAFLPPEATALQVAQIQSLPVPIPPSSAGFVISPACPARHAMTGGGCTATATGVHLVTTQPFDADQWFCTYENTTSGTQAIFAHAICSRVPGR